MEKDDQLRGQDRVLEICKRLGASQYVNPMGGMALYEGDVFQKHNIELRFLQPQAREYPQFGAPHVAALSVIDTLMFNDAATVREMCAEYRLVPR